MPVEVSNEFDIEATVNGMIIRRRVRARQSLADFLRDELDYTGTHLGCEHGVCGACTVLVDGRTARACLMLAVQLHGRAVETIEGLSDRGAIDELQREFAARNAAQCGFCTPGMLATACELVTHHPGADRGAIRDVMSGNLCRCTGYQAIVDAIEAVLESRRSDAR
jgi:carbon-monoxide dehydrogenase small subunit